MENGYEGIEGYLITSTKERQLVKAHTNIPHEKILNYIHKNRCRDLSMEEIDKLIDDVRLEMTLSKSMWDEFGIPRKDI